jgi:hypothetical protein
VSADEKQPTLFPVPTNGKHWTQRVHAPARPDSAPQVEAAAKVGPHVGRQCRRILEALADRGPMTREQIVEATGIRESAACARINALEHAGQIRKDGRQEASSGVHVTVYRRTDNAG